MRDRGFTVIELLVVVAIIGILGSIVLASLKEVRFRAQYQRSIFEMRQMEVALYEYKLDHDDEFPPDVDRNLPPGLENYLHNPNAAGEWPEAAFRGGVYDWENWEPDDLAYDPKEQVYQISLRFCDVHGNNCKFPEEDWAVGFDRYSAVYLCLEGPCRAHSNKPVDHPGYCLNC